MADKEQNSSTPPSQRHSLAVMSTFYRITKGHPACPRKRTARRRDQLKLEFILDLDEKDAPSWTIEARKPKGMGQA